MKRRLLNMTWSNLKFVWRSLNSQRLGCFKTYPQLMKKPSTHGLFFHYKSSGVMFYVLSDLIKIYQPVFEKNVNKHYKMSRNDKTDSYITTPWHVKTSEFKISCCYEASIVSNSSRKHALVQQNERYARFLC